MLRAKRTIRRSRHASLKRNGLGQIKNAPVDAYSQPDLARALAYGQPDPFAPAGHKGNLVFQTDVHGCGLALTGYSYEFGTDCISHLAR